MILNAKIGKVSNKLTTQKYVLVLVETDENIRPESTALLDSDFDCYLLVHQEIERLDELALALENINKEVRLARNFNELKDKGILIDELNQITVKILK
ncbi:MULTISPECIES: hypothetical protein [unclassified Sphingobacterium]|uniref:hypothetical protein n=1 Tax=unclassified Sphingobacterium TaxID=2609468 RepID=UPI0025DC2033|nr:MULTISPECIES: hypothetical protein [unclassified Sphingobacterium]